MATTKGRVETFRFESAVLAGNPLGDPTARDVPVYLPGAYDENPERRFPVVYVLSGFSGTGRTLLNVPPFDEALAPDRLDRLVEGGMPPAIAVFPDCSTRNGGSQYLDSAGTGNYGTYLARELVPAVDARYRTLARRESRAIVGKSSGGFGALVNAMDHPQVFSACGSHSGDCYFEHCYGLDFPRFVREIRRRGGVERFLATFPSLEVVDKEDVFLINVIAMAQCYSPNPEKPLPANFDLPFDLETGELKPGVFGRWKAWDPVERACLRTDALRSMRAIYLDAGDRDEFFLDLGARILSRRLTSLGVEHVHDEFRGGHFYVQKRYDRSLPLLVKALDRECMASGKTTAGLTALSRSHPRTTS